MAVSRSGKTNQSSVSGTAPVTARRQRRSHLEMVVAEVTEQIRSGALAPGERLASFQELAERYGVSQGLIAKALALLVKAGFVETQPRRGCYVARHLSSPATAAGLANRTATGISGPERAAPGSLLSPRGTPVRQLAVYVSQLLPSQLALWDTVLAEFCRAHPGLEIRRFSCLDGAPQDVAAQRKLDLIETTPLLLAGAGAQFTCPPDLGMIGVQAAALLPLVQERLAAGVVLPGVPFALTLFYLFANATLLAEAGLTPEAPATLAELVTRAQAAERRLAAAGAGRQGLITASLGDYMLLTGALQFHSGAIRYRPERARDVLRQFADSALTSGNPDDIPRQFAAGRLAYMHHCSYEAVPLRAEAPFDWRQQPLPVVAEARVPAHLTVLALNRDTAHPQDVLALMQHLCSEPVQLAFARQLGNVPVLARAALAPEVLATHPAGADGYRRTLAHSAVLENEDALRALGQCCYLDCYLNNGAITVDAALARLGYALDLTFGKTLVVE